MPLPVELTQEEKREIFERIIDGKIKQTSNPNQYNAQCPFHNDSDPSFSFNTVEGKWNCKNPECRGSQGGNIASLLVLYYDIPKHYVPKKLMEMGYTSRVSDNDEIPKEKIEHYHSLLMNNDERLKYLERHRGLNKDTIRKFRLGWDGERYIIPIQDVDGTYVNGRRYKPNGKPKMLPWDSGFSTNLFPIKNLFNSDWVLILEGEMDALLANQIGYPAITTFGADVWKQKWNPYFDGKIVYICYDNDKAGVRGSRKVAKNIYPYASKVYVVELPIEEKGGDFTDYIHVQGHTSDDFDSVLEETEEFVIDQDEDGDDEDEVYDVALSDASRKDFYRKQIQTEALVTGKDISPSIIPTSVKLTCGDTGGELCDACPRKHPDSDTTHDITKPETIVDILDCTDDQQRGRIRRDMEIPSCKRFGYRPVSTENVEKIRIIPEVDIKDQGTGEYVVRMAYYLGHGIETNKAYRLTGTTIAHPRTQKVTHVFKNAEPIQDSVEHFHLTEGEEHELEIFQPDEDETVEEKFSEIYRDLVSNVTHIYQRNDLLCSVDLVYHSPLSFEFHEREIDRGWLELLVLGDTRTGKTETVKSISSHYEAGEVCIGENSTYAGLVGGVEQTGNEWMLTWGKIPRNDRKLVVVDEISSMTHEDIGRMTGMRSSGIAEITKIRTERTSARTRMIWMSNPRSNKTLSDFPFGVEAVPELIGKPEDISKFDFVVTASSDEINPEVYNKRDHPDVDHKYTSDLCHNLVLWVWSRSSDQVTFTEDATDKILRSAEWFGKKYSSSIPIVEAANQRIKLARLSAAVAGRMFSTDDEYEKIIVKEEHAEFASRFLNSLLTKESFGYDMYSDSKEREKVLYNKDQIKHEILNGPIENPEAFIDNLLNSGSFAKSDFVSFTNIDKNEAEEFLGFLLRSRALRKKGYQYHMTSSFSKLLRRCKRDRFGSKKNVQFL